MNKNSTILKYPSELQTSKCIRLVPYRIKSNKDASFQFIGGEKNLQIYDTNTENSKYVYLPIPGNFQINIDNNYEDVTRIGTTATDAVINKLTEKVLNGPAGGAITSIFSLRGISYNIPKLANYNGTNPLNFNFNWKFLPQKKEEIIQILKIINYIKLQSMGGGLWSHTPEKEDKKNNKSVEDSASILQKIRDAINSPVETVTDITLNEGIEFLSKVATGRFITAPPLWDLEVGSAGNANVNYFFNENKISNLILTNASINYSPDGEFYCFRDGTPTAIELNLSFRTAYSPVGNYNGNTQLFG